MFGIAPEMQHAAGRPARVGLAGEAGARGEEAGAGQARDAVVVHAGQWAQHPGQIARGASGRRFRLFQNGDLPARGSQRVSRGAARDAGADHDGTPLGGRLMTVRPARAEAAGQHLPFAGKTGALLEFELGVFQRLAHRAGHRPGRQRRPFRRQPGERLAQLRRPQLRVLGGREAIEEKGIDGGVDRAQLRRRIAEEQGQDDIAAIEVQAMHTRREQRPVGLQFGGEGGELRPGLLRGGEVGSGERVFFAGNEMQAAAALRVVAPGLPGGQEIEAETEAGFENDEAVAPLPAGGQVVAGEKDMAGLGRAAGGRVVDVAVGDREGRAVRRELEAGGLEFVH